MARPSKLPRWATTGVKVEPTETKKDQGWLTGEKPPAQYDNWFKDLVSQWLGFFDVSIGAGYFGDGSDGDASLDGTVAAPSWAVKSSNTYFLTRDVYLDNLTLTSTAIIDTAGFRLFVNSVCDVGASAAISDNGKNGSGRFGGAGTGAGSIGRGSDGGGGGYSGNGGIAVAGANKTNSLGGNGGAGGDALAASNPGVLGAGGTRTLPAAAAGGPRSLFTYQTAHILGTNGDGVTFQGVVLQGGAAGGGGAGGYNGFTGYGQGGGGGGGAGVVMLAARHLVLAGIVSADGGDGAAGSLEVAPGDSAGGGGGGGGGLVIVMYGSKTGSGTITAAAGAGGAGFAGGSPGAAGAAGTVLEMDLSISDGTATGPHEESGVGAMVDTGSGNGVDYLDAVFVSPFSASDYEFEFSAYNTDGNIVVLTLIQKNTTTMRIKPTAPFNGEISWFARKK